MIARPAFNSFGEIAANPAGEVFCQLPLDLFGKLSKALQFAYLALLSAWNKLTQTDISRTEFLRLVNEERAKQGLDAITSLRTVTWYFAVFKALGVITRERMPGDVWVTTSTKPVRSALPVDVSKPAVESEPVATEVNTAGNTIAVELEYGQRLVEFCEGKGWCIQVNSDDTLELTPRTDMEQEELGSDAKLAMKKNRGSILAYLKRPFPALE